MSFISKAMRVIAASMKYPVIILLLLLIAVSVFMIDALNEAEDNDTIRLCILRGGLLKRQKAALSELTMHEDITPLMRESLAVRLIHQEQSFYDRRLKISDVIAKIAPMLGLLGTLIPLGPGIIALGQGDTITLSSSLLTAFDTTILGLIAAAVAVVISTIRSRWYSNYMSVLETMMECILEVEKKNAEA